jgi:hypothetical protein
MLPDGVAPVRHDRGVRSRHSEGDHGAGESTVEHYGVGAAWTLSPSEAIPEFA